MTPSTLVLNPSNPKYRHRVTLNICYNDARAFLRLMKDMEYTYKDAAAKKAFDNIRTRLYRQLATMDSTVVAPSLPEAPVFCGV